MKHQKKYQKMNIMLFFLSLLICFSVLLLPGLAQADSLTPEMMFLRGKLVDINYKTGRVVVDVATLGCEGRKTFDAGNNMSKFPGREGKMIDFYIDSDSCKDSSGYKMISPRRTK